ncbi:rRNA-processing protein UTP23 homolog isoform X2 [Varroa destructor]|uniref:Uncharacterized protein n=1 Tax=Varroa destructor TaxID=109461 RepID=A0A7M7KL31_VARDE|nr:rRNA-processing protein UTP23 homolog isoform X2 [Varroa destructor]
MTQKRLTELELRVTNNYAAGILINEKRSGENTEQIDKYFRTEVTLCTTQCAVVETQKLSILNGALQILKNFRVEKCPHTKPVAASKCLLDMVREGNPRNFFVATQDPELAEEIHKLIGIPRLKLHNAITLEDPASATVNYVAKQCRSATDLTENQLKTISHLKKKMNIDDSLKKVKRLKKKPKGPNPLSCLPKKKKSATAALINDPSADSEGPRSLSKAARRKMRLKRLKITRSHTESD